MEGTTEQARDEDRCILAAYKSERVAAGACSPLPPIPAVSFSWKARLRWWNRWASGRPHSRSCRSCSTGSCPFCS